jgi:AraC-like DNA-binding protein
MALLTNHVFDDTDVLPVLPLQEGSNELIDEAFTDLLKAYHNEGPFNKAILSAYLKILLYKIYTLKKQPVPSATFFNADLERFRSFQLLVEEGFIRHHSVAHYADMLHLSTKSLANLTLKFTRKPPQQLIQERLVLQAKRYLYHSGLSVKEIAVRLGFADQAYFNRFFKRNTSLAPNQFRQRQRTE